MAISLTLDADKREKNYSENLTLGALNGLLYSPQIKYPGRGEPSARLVLLWDVV
jgi:hypothetical protein